MVDFYLQENNKETKLFDAFKRGHIGCYAIGLGLGYILYLQRKKSLSKMKPVSLYGRLIFKVSFFI
jgi:hypothetical protein